MILLVATGCEAGAAAAVNYELAVQRHSEADGRRIWVVDSQTGMARRVPQAIDGPQECLGWVEGQGLYIVEGDFSPRVWVHVDGIAPHAPFGSVFEGSEVTLFRDGHFLVNERRPEGLLPGSYPPPSEATLEVFDPSADLEDVFAPEGDLLAWAGEFGEVSVGNGPSVLTWTTSYTSLPPGEVGYDAESEWRLYRAEREEPVRFELEGNALLSPDGRYIAWRTDDAVTISDLDGRPLATSSGDAFAWGPAGHYAVRTLDGFRLATVDDTSSTSLASAGAGRPAWSPDPDRVLVEYPCDDAAQSFRQQVFDGSDVVLETSCEPHEFVQWDPSGRAFAVRNTAPSDVETASEFRVFSLDGPPSPWHEGVVCAFRPDGEH